MFTRPDLHSHSGLGTARRLAALAFVLLPTAFAQVGLGLAPMRTELRMAPGASYTGTLRLANEGSSVHIRGSILDFHLDAEQTAQFDSEFRDEAAYSCRRWLTVNPMETDLGGAGYANVRYTVRVPSDAQTRSYHCAIGFSTVAAPRSPGDMGLQTSVRVVAAIYVIIGAPMVEGQLSSIAVESVPGSRKLRAVVVMENSGRMVYRPIGSLEVEDLAGHVLEKHEVGGVPVLPERKQRVLVPLEIAEGQPCRIKVRVDIGTGEIQEGTAVLAAKIDQ